MCRPRVICAYPITPQTHMVEALGARAYTATASQGLLYISEAVYNAAGLGLPVVMTFADRAIGAPINICNDHSDAMSQRDAGWIQLYAETNQEAADLHIQAFRIAEELSNPVMVCMDGFLLTHASERVDLPKQEQVDAFLPPYEPRQVLDPDDPVPIGAMVGPETFTEVRPFPAQAVRDALGDDDRLRRLVVLERSLAPGAGGVVTADLRMALATGEGGPRDAIISTVIAGLGGGPSPVGRYAACSPAPRALAEEPPRTWSRAHEILCRPEERTEIIARIQASCLPQALPIGLLQDHPERARPATPGAWRPERHGP